MLDRDVYTVSRLNREVRALLEEGFSLIWLEGEISNLSRPASGHLYFSLKDANAQVRCALFRNRLPLLRTRLDNGLQVLVQARVSLYESRGDFQLIVEHLEEAGDGALRRAYDELRRRLEREGLFDPAHKRPPPRFPQRIGVITSPSGAAIRDVLTVLRRRFPALPVLIYPVPVQGEGAAAEIARTIHLASERGDCDVLLLVRGGGSLEDLWAFNEEAVARAIQACTLPIIAGIGHETDVTIADFAADLRAPTPSAAAELVSPDRIEWLGKFTRLEERLGASARRRLLAQRQGLTALEKRLERQHPGRRLQDRTQRLDELEQRLYRALRIRFDRLGTRIAGLDGRLQVQSPIQRVHRLEERLQILNRRLQAAMRLRLERCRQRLGADSRALHTVSPLQTVERGYAIVRRLPSREIIRRADQVSLQEPIEVLLNEGHLICRVEEIRRKKEK